VIARAVVGSAARRRPGPVRKTAQRLFAEHGFDAVTIADVEHCVRGPAGTLLDQQR
jgi:hypothetical protein